MTVREVLMMECDRCGNRYDLPSQGASAREAREDAAGRGWSHDLDIHGDRIDLCEPCTDQVAQLMGADLEPDEEGGER
jgi:streptogramin lyase